MLVLSRKHGTSIVIAGGITVTILHVRPGRVKLGIRAPKDMPVRRGPAVRSAPAGER